MCGFIEAADRVQFADGLDVMDLVGHVPWNCCKVLEQKRDGLTQSPVLLTLKARVEVVLFDHITDVREVIGNTTLGSALGSVATLDIVYTNTFDHHARNASPSCPAPFADLCPDP